MTRDEAIQVIRGSRLRRHANILEDALLASIRVLPGTDENSASHFGHFPRVPEGFEWPCWDRSDHLRSQIEFLETKIGPGIREQDPHLWKNLWGARIEEHRDHIANDPLIPLTFLLQIDLEEIPVPSDLTGLPADGLLYFFWELIDQPTGSDPASVGGWAVQHYPRSPHLVVAEPPLGVSRNHGKEIRQAMLELPRTPLRFAVEWVLPWACDRELTLDGHGGREAYEELAELLRELSGPEHRILGYANAIQSDPAEVAQLASHGIKGLDSGDTLSIETMDAGRQNWRLLLQIDDDEDGLGWAWGDVGRLYFMIPREDLARENFSRVWFDAQSS